MFEIIKKVRYTWSVSCISQSYKFFKTGNLTSQVWDLYTSNKYPEPQTFCLALAKQTKIKTQTWEKIVFTCSTFVLNSPSKEIGKIKGLQVNTINKKLILKKSSWKTLPNTKIKEYGESLSNNYLRAVWFSRI